MSSAMALPVILFDAIPATGSSTAHAYRQARFLRISASMSPLRSISPQAEEAEAFD